MQIRSKDNKGLYTLDFTLKAASGHGEVKERHKGGG